jgi:DNA polymerase III epsilon subunit-like protein
MYNILISFIVNPFHNLRLRKPFLKDLQDTNLIGVFLMQYVVFDLEMNQDYSSPKDNTQSLSKYPFEIIQIGAVKLDSSFHIIATFDRYVKPSIYETISPFITELTGITTFQLYNEDPFHKVFEAFINFINNDDTILVTWGMTDIKQLYKDAGFHEVDLSAIPHQYINLQPYASLHFGYPASQLLKLQHSVEALNIPMTVPFHNALNDAYYTMEIFKKLYHSFMQPQIYDPALVTNKIRQPKKVIDYDSLISQFEKMFKRSMNDEEQEIIRLAYHMGKTNQFQSINKL